MASKTDSKNLNINDIARLAGVSKATVSAVINDKAGVAEKTRTNVLDIIHRFDYKPNAIARSLSNRKTKSIGLIIKEIDNPYYTKIMHGVYDICSKQGYTVFLGSSQLSFEQEERGIEAFIDQQVDGLIITPLQGENRDFSYLSKLITNKYPLVLIGGVKNHATNLVQINSKEASRAAVRYLIEQGHFQIAYFSGPTNSAHSEEREQGYRLALSEAGIPFNSTLIFQAGADIEDGYEMGKSVFAGKSARPTAVFCYNDLVAIGLIHALQELKISIPNEVAVIGFDNIDFSRFANIPLTTVNNPALQLGEEAAKLLLKQIESPDEVLCERITLDASLLIRKSA